VENLTYTGAANFAGTGNNLANVITGGAGNDTLTGGTNITGNDTLVGGAGDDIYVVSNASDVVTELAGAGTDTVKTALTSFTLAANVENLTYTGAAAFTGIGNTLSNVIIGGVGADTLNDGGVGAVDTLIGGAGNDTYIVSNAGDVITENANGGTDTVKTTLASYTLGANLENLTYTGGGSFTGTGNTLANTITGGAGADILDGGANNAGVDTMIGGAGNDTYFVRNAGDVVTETAGNGTDTVMSAINSYTLGTNLENLTFIGSGSFIGTGNTQANVMTASSAIGQLTGGAGADTFVLSSGAIANRTVTITDFSHAAADQIILSGYGLGAHLAQISAVGANITQYSVQSSAGTTLDQFQLSNKAVLVTSDFHFA
jgi:Ca2+-binding RTX toxin-like protein